MNFSNTTIRNIFTVILVAIFGAGASLSPDSQKLETLCGYPTPSSYYRLGTYLYKMELMRNDTVWESDKNVLKVRNADGSVDLASMKAHILSRGIMTEAEFDSTMTQLIDAGLTVTGKTQFKATELTKWAQVIDECQTYRANRRVSELPPGTASST